MQTLRQSTAVDVLLGAFVDSTDGDTPETGLTIANTDTLISKNGQDLASRSDTTSCAHDSQGMYNCELDATDTNTVGTLVIYIKVAGARPVRHDFQVVEEAVYDISYAASATGDVGISAQAVDDVWDEVLTGGTHNVNNSSGKRLRQIAANVFSEGTAQSGGTNSIQLASGAVSTNEQFARASIILTAGTGAGQEAIVTSSVASTDTLTITPQWLTNPDATTEYQVVPGQVHTTVRNGGYDNGMVFIDTVNGTAGTEKGVHGTSTHPSLTIADAYTVATNEGISSFFVYPGSSLVLPSDSSGLRFEGFGYTVNLNGQDIGDTTFIRAGAITGVGIDSGSTSGPNFTECGIGSCTLPPCTTLGSGFFGTVTIGSAGNFSFLNGLAVFGGSLVIDYNVALNASNVHLPGWTGGGVEIQNTGAGTGTYLFQMDGTGDLTVNANCSSTTTVTTIGTINRNADVAGISYDDSGNIIEVVGTAGEGLTDLGGMSTGMKIEINAEVDDVLSVDTHAEIGTETPAATQSMKKMIQFLYKAWRNKSTETSSTYTLFNDDGTTSGQESTVSDNGTTFTVTEKVTG